MCFGFHSSSLGSWVKSTCALNGGRRPDTFPQIKLIPSSSVHPPFGLVSKASIKDCGVNRNRAMNLSSSARDLVLWDMTEDHSLFEDLADWLEAVPRAYAWKR